jgi:hypothetical protein
MFIGVMNIIQIMFISFQNWWAYRTFISCHITDEHKDCSPHATIGCRVIDEHKWVMPRVPCQHPSSPPPTPALPPTCSDAATGPRLPHRRDDPSWTPPASPPSLPLPCEFEQYLVKFERKLLPYVIVCRNVNEICYYLHDLSEFDSIKLISLLNLESFMEFSDSWVNFSGF